MISRASSRRRTGSPNSLVVTAALPSFRYRKLSSGVPHRGVRGVHGLLDVGVAGAPAEVAADRVVDLLLGELRRVVPLLEPRGDRGQEARRAEPALEDRKSTRLNS